LLALFSFIFCFVDRLWWFALVVKGVLMWARCETKGSINAASTDDDEGFETRFVVFATTPHSEAPAATGT
jgi:hypothetical protein